MAITFAQKGKNEAGQMMTKTSIVNLVDLAGRYVQRHRINCLPFLKRFISLVDLTQVFPLSIRPQTRSNLSPVVLQLIAVAGTKFFFQDSGLKVTAGRRTMCGAPYGHLSGQLSACRSF